MLRHAICTRHAPLTLRVLLIDKANESSVNDWTKRGGKGYKLYFCANIILEIILGVQLVNLVWLLDFGRLDEDPSEL